MFPENLGALGRVPAAQREHPTPSPGVYVGWGESGGGKLSSLFLILSLISFLVSCLTVFPPQITKDYLNSVPENLSQGSSLVI